MSGSMGRSVRTGAVLALAAAAVLFPWLADRYYVYLVTQAMVLGIAATGLNLVLGYGGMANFGYAAYVGTGAYTAALLGIHWKPLVVPGVAAAALVAMVAAAVAGLVALRTSGISFVMITMAIGQALWGLAYRWVSLTGGDNGLSGVPAPQLWEGLPLTPGGASYYYLVAVALALVLAGMYACARSPFGYCLRALQDSESRARVLGYDTWLYKYLAYVASGAVAGAAGGLNAYLTRFVSPGELSIAASSELFLMTILGGPGTVWGPPLGALAVTLLRAFISAHTNRWVMFLGFIYILVVLLAPRGVAGSLESRMRRWFGLPGALPLASAARSRGSAGR